MYKRQEAARIRQEFWTTFGRYMSPVPSFSDEPVNWVNYKTGEKFIFIRKDQSGKKAYIGLELQHPDEGMRALYFEQLTQLKNIFLASAGEGWIWETDFTDETGKKITRIYKEVEGYSIFNKEHWPELIRFFKENMILLDEFWSQAKYSFEALR